MSGERVATAEGLERRYRVGGGMFKAAGEVQALRGVSFTLDRGRTLAVVGESGCGKSTLARLVTLIEPPSAGRLELDGTDPVGADAATARRLRRTVQIVFQNPYGSLNPRQKIADILGEPLAINTDVAGKRARRGRGRDAAPGRPAARARAALPAHVLGRPAPAHRHRQGADAAPQAGGARRAGLGAGPLDPGPGPQPPGRAAGRVRARLPVHRPQPLGRAPFRRRRHGHVSRPRRRAGQPRRRSSTTRSTPIPGPSSPPRRSPTRRGAAPAPSSWASCPRPCTRPPAASSTPAAPWPTPAAARRCRSCSRCTAGRWPATRSRRAGRGDRAIYRSTSRADLQFAIGALRITHFCSCYLGNLICCPSTILREVTCRELSSRFCSTRPDTKPGVEQYT